MNEDNTVVVPVPDGLMGISLKGVYDGVIIWMALDGTFINRFENVPGYEAVSAEAAKYIEYLKDSGNKNPEPEQIWL